MTAGGTRSHVHVSGMIRKYPPVGEDERDEGANEGGITDRGAKARGRHALVVAGPGGGREVHTAEDGGPLTASRGMEYEPSMPGTDGGARAGSRGPAVATPQWGACSPSTLARRRR